MLKDLNWPLRFGVAFAAALMLAGAASPARADLTVEQCSAEWNASAASGSCSNAEIEVREVKGTAMCKVTADCTTNAGGTQNDEYIASLDRLSELINCNGLLKIEYCSEN